jgi:RNA polymerase sigma factor (sigma-70 family)
MRTSEGGKELSDGELLSRYVSGASPDAFAILVRRHIDFIYSVALRQVRDRHLAHDVTQGVFLIVVRKAPSLTNYKHLGGWLFRTAMLEARNISKRRFREARRLASLHANPQQQDDPMQSQAWKEIEPHLNLALEDLNDAEREAVILRYIQGSPYDRVAAALGISEPAARQRVHRGLERMRTFLSGRGIVASAAGLSGLIKLNAVQAAPAELLPTTLQAAAQLSAQLAKAKGIVALMTALKAKGVAAVLLLGSAVIAAGVVAIIVRHRHAGETLYIDPAPGDRAVVLKQSNESPSLALRPVRRPFQLIPAKSCDDRKGSREVGGFIGYINKGDWLRFDRFDFGTGGMRGGTFEAVVSCPDPYIGNMIQVRQDAPEGPILAMLTVKSTGGYGNWKPQSAAFSGAAPEGIHDIFLVFSGGGWNLDKIRFTLSARSGVQAIPADTFNDARGVQTRGQVIRDTEDGQWARYNGLDFGKGVNAVAITYSCDAAHAGGKIGFRLDQLEGPTVGELSVENTGGFGRFVTRVIPINSIMGSHNVVITFSGKGHGIGNVLDFQFLNRADEVSDRRPDGYVPQRSGTLIGSLAKMVMPTFAPRRPTTMATTQVSH